MKVNKESLLGLKYITHEQFEAVTNLVRNYIYFFDNLRHELLIKKVHEKIYFPNFTEGKKNRIKRGLHPKILYTYLLWKEVEKEIIDESKQRRAGQA